VRDAAQGAAEFFQRAFFANSAAAFKFRIVSGKTRGCSRTAFRRNSAAFLRPRGPNVRFRRFQI